ncbi:MAG: TldD/PmbA family protein [Candidatus Bathyarchaeota archaeon]|jgi:TldD protein|nr:TldD/PmbA family protein [Candidatus Bathyarchaeota archaeon A05DMB-3]MDH7606709.1 TldD/PmbA family protein [Candidatus Bathyarchaeota archaeon]
MSEDFGKFALKEAEKNGASYADIRISEILNENLTVKNGEPETISYAQVRGFGIRVIVDGAWGFAGSVDVSKDEIKRCVEKAVSIAKASAMLKKREVVLAKEKVYREKYATSFKKDPFKVPLEEKLKVLVEASRFLKEFSPLVNVSYAHYRGYRENKLFMSSEGAEINQQVIWCGGGISAIAVKGSEVQVRSYPSAFRGDFATCGYEFFEALALMDHAQTVGKELIQLFEAEKCPSGEMDLILRGDQLALQIHESCGHPTELDRVLGTEADYAGTSFLTPEKLGKFRYGSGKVNIVADATAPMGLGTFGFDDEGTKAKKVYLVKEGVFTGYQSSRETAAQLGLKESSGGMRADSPLALPIIRMTNINLLPGDYKAEEIIEDTREGVLMMTNRSWSIDDKRINFQFGTEIGGLIKNGSLDKIVKNPTYMGVTPQFWGSCDAVSRDDWKMWGTPNCGKGVPGQVMYVGHGCGTARFRKVRVGLIR